MKVSSLKLARMGVVAGLYIVLSLFTFPVASGAIQFRISEGLTLLPLIFPETAVGLFIGCIFANLITGCALVDIFVGAFITLFACVLTAIIGMFIKNKPLKILLGGLFPVIMNAFLLPLIWWFCYGRLDYVYMLQVAFLLAGQALSVYVIGTPTYLFCDRAKRKGYRGFTDN